MAFTAKSMGVMIGVDKKHNPLSSPKPKKPYVQPIVEVGGEMYPVRIARMTAVNNSTCQEGKMQLSSILKIAEVGELERIGPLGPNHEFEIHPMTLFSQVDACEKYKLNVIQSKQHNLDKTTQWWTIIRGERAVLYHQLRKSPESLNKHETLDAWDVVYDLCRYMEGDMRKQLELARVKKDATLLPTVHATEFLCSIWIHDVVDTAGLLKWLVSLKQTTNQPC